MSSEGSPSYNCIGADFGKSRIRTNITSRPCNTQECPSWAAWEESSACNSSCGGGTRELISYCRNMDGSESTLCNGNYFFRPTAVYKVVFVCMCVLALFLKHRNQWRRGERRREKFWKGGAISCRSFELVLRFRQVLNHRRTSGGRSSQPLEANGGLGAKAPAAG